MPKYTTSAGGTICTLFAVVTWRTQRLCFPASSITCTTDLPSGEIAAIRDFPVFVRRVRRMDCGCDVVHIVAIAREGHAKVHHLRGRNDLYVVCSCHLAYPETLLSGVFDHVHHIFAVRGDRR